MELLVGIIDVRLLQRTQQVDDIPICKKFPVSYS